MILLIAGVVVWTGTHWFPALGASQRARLIERIGEGPYKGLFTLAIVSAIALIVLGWRSTEFIHVYAPPSWGAWVTEGMMLIALWLFIGVGSPRPSNAKRLVRHPQLMGVLTWSVAHLLANGDGRSVALFAGLGCWAVSMIALLNRRDGPWTKPERVPARRDLLPIGLALVAFVVLFFAHPHFAGVPPPRPW